MCRQCVDAVKTYWPDLREEQCAILLWGATCFPFGTGEQTAAQVKEMAEKSGCDLGKALAIAAGDET